MDFTKANSQMQTPAETHLTEPSRSHSATLSRWERVIQQLLIQSNGSKGHQDAFGTEIENENEIERPPASYSPPLPPPDGLIPPPAFTYMSPANGSDADGDGAETDFENAQSPPPRYFRWNSNSQWMIQADKDK